jgi:hypothetical protein
MLSSPMTHGGGKGAPDILEYCRFDVVFAKAIYTSVRPVQQGDVNEMFEVVRWLERPTRKIFGLGWILDLGGSS